jgi:hypothetical protein
MLAIIMPMYAQKIDKKTQEKIDIVSSKNLKILKYV